MVLKVKEINRIKYKILNMKIKHRIFRSRALYSRFVYSTRVFLSVFCALGVVCSKFGGKNDKQYRQGPRLPVACILVKRNHQQTAGKSINKVVEAF